MSIRSPFPLPTALVALFLGGNAPAQEPLRQDLARGDVLVVADDTARLPDLIQASARLNSNTVYQDGFMDVGLHVRTGRTTDWTSAIRAAHGNTSHVIGVHGDGTVVRFRGHWQGDGNGAFPHLLLTEGGRMVFEAEARVDLVQARSYFTRQLWVWGDGTGTLELAEGFVADRTRSDPVDDALGTVRLGGATLITHHTRNMPQNTRSDGRGGIYPNGHVVFERVPGNTWRVLTNHQTYAAQVDFRTSGVIDTQAHLTHTGQRRIALPVNDTGHFTSSGAFRTLDDDVVITKRGPSMLSLEGEQAYRPGAVIEVEEGLLRVCTDPGMGARTDAQAGPYLTIRVRSRGRLHLTAPVLRLARIELHDEAEAWLDRDCVLDLSGGLFVAEGATFHQAGEVRGTREGTGQVIE